MSHIGYVTAAQIEAVRNSLGILYPDNSDATLDADLISGGYLDSLALVASTAHFEGSSDIALNENYVFRTDFTATAGIAQTVSRRMGTASMGRQNT